MEDLPALDIATDHSVMSIFIRALTKQRFRTWWRT